MMKMTPDEFQAIKNKLQESADEGFAQGQSELAEKIIEHLEEITIKIVRQQGTVIRVSDFQCFTNEMINSMKSYRL